MTRRRQDDPGDGARILPFAPTPPSPPPPAPTPSRRPAGLVATLSIEATEIKALVAQNLADRWVAALIAEHRRTTGRWPPDEAGRCGAPRRDPPHAPCQSTALDADGRCRWHRGAHETPAT